MSNKLTTKSNIPTLSELYDEKALSISSKQNDLNILLNTEPPLKWIKTHPIAKNLRYVAIDKIEYLLTSIFIRWHVEIKEVKVIANSIVTVVRLYYKDPISGEMLFQDGVGACPLQVDKGARADDFGSIKSNAVQLGAPASESYAFKDAAEKIGKLFGKDLNRTDLMNYEALSKKFNSDENAQDKENERIYKYISECVTAEALENAKGHLLTDDLVSHYNNKLNELSK